MISRTAWQQAEELNGLNNKEKQIATQQQTLTILFTDIEGFTTLSETVPAAELFDDLNRYFDILATTVYGQRGDVDKFLGDGMLAFFEEPSAALHAAMLIQKRVDAFNDQQIVARQTPFPTRISLVTGPCLLARIGSRDRQEITVLGDTVNLASRLQALAPPGGIVMDEQTFAATGQPPALHTTAKIRGKSNLQPIYEIEAAQLSSLHKFLKVSQPLLPQQLTEE
jgi:adenylate cyclase